MADKKCPRCGLWSTGSALYCDCGYDFENGIITEPNNKLKLLDYLKHPAYFWEFHKLPTLVGLGVSFIHFITTPFLLASSFASIRHILGLILAAPGFILSFIFDSFFQSVSSSPDSLISDSQFSHSELKWDAVQKLSRTRSYIFMYITQHGAIVIPRRAFTTQETWDQFWLACQSGVNPA